MSLTLHFTLLRSARFPRGSCDLEDLRGLTDFVLSAEEVSGVAEIALDLTSPTRIQALNRHFRGVDRTTDVIAFRYQKPPVLAGDIAINGIQAGLQARKMGHALKREVRLLLIHGLLHLLDYTDYEPVPRRRMFQRQNTLLRRWEKQRS